MKSRISTYITAITILAALAIPIRVYLAAQHTRYKLVDIGTLGGPTSYESVNGDGNLMLNSAGIVGGWADTSTPDPTCYVADCFVTHAFRWEDGILTELPTLPGANNNVAVDCGSGAAAFALDETRR